MFKDALKANLASAIGRLVGGKVRNLVYSKYGHPDPHKSREEIEKNTVQKFNQLLTKYNNTLFGMKRIQETGITEIKNIEDLQEFPLTTRQDIEEHGLEMIIQDMNPKKLRQTHTSGTTTGKQVIIYRSGTDLMQAMLGLTEAYDSANTRPDERIMMLVPRESSAWEANGVLQIVMPGLRFIDSTESRINEKIVKKLLSAACINSYANLPVQVFNQYKEFVKKARENNEIKLKGIVLSGDYASQANIDRLHELLGKNVKIINPLMGIELAAFTKTCPKGHNHIISDYYYAWINPETQEIIGTPLSSEAMIYPNYCTGDSGRIFYPDDCGWNWPAIEFLGRTRADELHKSFRLDTIKEAIQSSKAFKEFNFIRADTGAYETHVQEHEPFRREFNIYIIRGPKYPKDKNIDTKITEELKSLILDNFVPRLYGAGSEIKNWEYKFHVIDEHFEAYPLLGLMPGKWKPLKKVI